MQCKVCGHDNPAEARFCANCGATVVAVAETPPPAAAPEMAVEYAGFWIRFAAAVIDSVVISIISLVLSYFTLYIIFGYLTAFYFSFGWFPLYWLYYWLFTGFKGQTPGKLAVGIKVVNAQGNKVGLGRAALREILGKTISNIIFCLGFLWIALDSQKQGWHDKIASTYVVKVIKAKSKG